MNALASIKEKLRSDFRGTRFQFASYVRQEITPTIATALLKHGSYWLGNDLIMKRGRPRECHDNALNLAIKMGWDWFYGFALSDDGCWRIHSWCIDKKTRVVETTERRLVYFGICASGSILDELIRAYTSDPDLRELAEKGHHKTRSHRQGS